MISGLYYDFDYSGSGFQTGAPKDLSSSQTPILGFPTHKDALNARASLLVKF